LASISSDSASRFSVSASSRSCSEMNDCPASFSRRLYLAVENSTRLSPVLIRPCIVER
jgi:hypothetical protein